MSTELPGRTTANEQLLLNRADLKRLGIRVSSATLLRWEYIGRFPRRIRMAGTSVAWLKSEIEQWLAERAEERCRTFYADPY